MDLAPIAAERLRRHRLTGVPLATPEAVVAWLGAVQAQEHLVAPWSLGARAEGVREEDVDAAFAAGRIVRTHVLRDTWHYVAAEDLRWLVRLTGPRIAQRNATMHRRLGLDDALLARTDALIAEALGGGAHRTRAEIAATLAERGVAVSGPALAYVLMHAELGLVACSGAPRGRRQTYALVDARVPAATGPSGDAALAALAARFLRARGPATAQDLASWASLTLTDARRALALLGEDAVGTTDGGRTWWAPRAAPPAERPGPPRAHLLQGYDEYGVAYRDSRDVIADASDARPGALHVLVVDGRVAGRWRRRETARRVEIEVEPGRPLSGDERAAVDDAVGRYRAFTGRVATWATAGP